MSYNPGNFGGGSSLGIDLSNLPTFDDIVIDISPEQIEAALARYNANAAKLNVNTTYDQDVADTAESEAAAAEETAGVATGAGIASLPAGQEVEQELNYNPAGYGYEDYVEYAYDDGLGEDFYNPNYMGFEDERAIGIADEAGAGVGAGAGAGAQQQVQQQVQQQEQAQQQVQQQVQQQAQQPQKQVPHKQVQQQQVQVQQQQVQKVRQQQKQKHIALMILVI